ncbi:MAG: PqqD family protein [Kiritimatiellae bacterium]|nr:PqqD family protein [Kiritimatiellia bacterium]
MNAAESWSEATRVKPVGRWVLRRIGEDRLLVPVGGDPARKNIIYPLNETAALLWERWIAGDTLGQASRAVSETFSVDQAKAFHDSLELCAELAREGVLAPVE